MTWGIIEQDIRIHDRSIAIGLCYSNTTAAVGISTVTESQLRTGIMPRALLSKAACEIAVKKASHPDVKQFAEWELMEATTVVNVLRDLNTAVTPLGQDAQAFLSKLGSLEKKAFDAEYMQAELSNHEFLRDLAQEYVDGFADESPANEGEIWHVANLALFAFTEHVGLCKKIATELQ